MHACVGGRRRRRFALLHGLTVWRRSASWETQAPSRKRAQTGCVGGRVWRVGPAVLRELCLHLFGHALGWGWATGRIRRLAARGPKRKACEGGARGRGQSPPGVSDVSQRVGTRAKRCVLDGVGKCVCGHLGGAGAQGDRVSMTCLAAHRHASQTQCVREVAGRFPSVWTPGRGRGPWLPGVIETSCSAQRVVRLQLWAGPTPRPSELHSRQGPGAQARTLRSTASSPCRASMRASMRPVAASSR